MIIQGGMGIGVSDWRLARAVSLQGELGVVSGTGINCVFIRRLQLGDVGGHVRRALAHFVDHTTVEKILKTYFVEGGIDDVTHFKLSSVAQVHAPIALQRLNVVAGFVEVFLAKEAHNGLVGINLLEKLQTSNLPTLYGAMLAGVDAVLIGAGVPREMPGVIELFTNHDDASVKANLTCADATSDVKITFRPRAVFPGLDLPRLKSPLFFPIISSLTLAQHLVQRSTGKVDGFVVEGALAGGHNAPPRGQLKLSERGEPIYGVKDQADLTGIRELGLPFWLAGSYGSPDRLNEALSLGANGIQVGTAFAFCDESGITKSLRQRVIRSWTGLDSLVAEPVFTDPLASPTGFPFKVVKLPDTLSEKPIYEARPRKCDLGYLRQILVGGDGKLVYRCPAEPVEDFVRKGGKVEDTVDRKCLCNALLANIGLGQRQDDGYHEQPLLTSGDDLLHLRQFVAPGADHYSAKDVLGHLKSALTEVHIP
ncbi:MAG: nitronate monooxygenase [Candidatus Kapabacteria bacterium]|nr:nitronate monooxygenase [Candidatus Kapabacteria bacterium]